MKLPYNPAIPPLGIHPDKTIIQRETCTLMFTAALFVIAKKWKQPKCPPADAAAAAAAKSLQSCPTLCDPIDGSPPGSPVPGIVQARTLEWVAISFSNAWKWNVKVNSLSCVTPWTAAYQAPLSMGFFGQEYSSGLPCPPGKLGDRGIKPASLCLLHCQAGSSATGMLKRRMCAQRLRLRFK